MPLTSAAKKLLKQEKREKEKECHSENNKNIIQNEAFEVVEGHVQVVDTSIRQFDVYPFTTQQLPPPPLPPSAAVHGVGAATGPRGRVYASSFRGADAHALQCFLLYIGRIKRPFDRWSLYHHGHTHAFTRDNAHAFTHGSTHAFTYDNMHAFTHMLSQTTIRTRSYKAIHVFLHTSTTICTRSHTAIHMRSHTAIHMR